MGANAVTTVPVYVAGEVLTAADLNITNSGIPVFASSVERDAAFGGTGEKTLAEGQYAFLEDTNATQFYDGAVWQPVGVTPGLVCVKAETAFSAVASLTADSVFTSTYTNYLVLVRYTTSSDALAMQFGAATVYAATNYNYQRVNMSSTTVSATQSTAQTSGFIGGASGGDFFQLATLTISGVQLAAPTVYVSQSARTNSAYTAPMIDNYHGNHSTATAYDGLKLLVTAGTMTGTYAIYGYSKTV
jgi:hypothetical protein